MQLQLKKLKRNAKLNFKQELNPRIKNLALPDGGLNFEVVHLNQNSHIVLSLTLRSSGAHPEAGEPLNFTMGASKNSEFAQMQGAEKISQRRI